MNGLIMVTSAEIRLYSNVGGPFLSGSVIMTGQDMRMRV